MPTLRASNFRRPGGGLANAERQHLLAPDEFSSMQNLKCRNGNIAKRGGVLQQGDAPDAANVKFLMHTYDNSGNTNRIRVCNGKLQYLTGGAWTNISTGHSTTAFWRAVQYQNNLFICNGSQARKSSIGAVPADGAWGGLGTIGTPSLVTLHKNRLYIGGISANPTYVYMSGPGTPEVYATTDFYQFPDNQQGFTPQEIKSFGEWIGVFCEDYVINLSGTGPLTHKAMHYPKGAALVCPRTVVDMGGYAIYHTDRGCAIWDGYGKPELLDPHNRINWDDFDLTTPNNTWAMKWSDREYAIFYKSKGTPTAPTGATYLLTSTARSSHSIWYSLRSRLTLSSATGDTQTAHYLLYDTIQHQWSGPHTGNYLCGDMESYRNADKQVPWVGSATTSGLVGKAEQTTFTDMLANGTTQNYETILRTGGLFDATTRCTLDRVKILFGSQPTSTNKALVQLFWEGRPTDPSDAEWAVSLGYAGKQGIQNSYVGETYRGEFVLARLSPYPGQGSRFKGYQPVIEIHEATTDPYEIRALEATMTPTPDEQEGD